MVNTKMNKNTVQRFKYVVCLHGALLWVFCLHIFCHWSHKPPEALGGSITTSTDSSATDSKAERKVILAGVCTWKLLGVITTLKGMGIYLLLLLRLLKSYTGSKHLIFYANNFFMCRLQPDCMRVKVFQQPKCILITSFLS